jgi:peroxiredoxin
VAGVGLANTPRPAPEPAPWLGVGFNGGSGIVVVNEVIRDTPADIAGIVLGDVIVGIDDKPVRNGDDLISKIRSHRVGDKVQVSVSRRGRVVKMWTELTGHLDPGELIQRRLVDKPAPPFALTRMHGKHSGELSQLQGKVVVLEFMSTDCAACKNTFEALANFEAESIGEAAVLTITPESSRTLNNFLKNYTMALTVLHDPRDRLKRIYKAELNGPTVVVIGRDGIVRHAGTGPELNIDDLLLEARRAVRERPSI